MQSAFFVLPDKYNIHGDVCQPHFLFPDAVFFQAPRIIPADGGRLSHVLKQAKGGVLMSNRDNQNKRDAGQTQQKENRENSQQTQKKAQKENCK